MCRQFDSGPRHHNIFMREKHLCMLVYVSVFLIGALTVALVVWAGIQVRARGRRSDTTHTDQVDEQASPSETSGSLWSYHVGTIGESHPSGAEEEVPAWRQYEKATNGGISNVYRTRPTFSAGGPRWDPYDESQSRAQRAQAARRKPRPYRAPLDHESKRPERRRVDIYDLLGVSRYAALVDIERAFRAQVGQFHPDHFHDDPEGRGAAEERLKQLNLAMEVLRDTKRRAHYDLGHTS